MWVGSDEAMRVYLNDELVYDYTRRRTFRDNELVKDKVPVRLQAGENRLLVKLFQEMSAFDFALNLCEPEDDPQLDGNRVMGLRFRTEPATPTAVTDAVAAGLPEDVALRPNYPNPFNVHTVIPYRLPAGSESMPVRLDIYDVQGQRIRSLADRSAGPGWHQSLWDGLDDDGVAVASGFYLYRLQIGDRVLARKMLLIQ